MPPRDATNGRWLSIVGIGEDGLAGLSPTARAAIEGAELVFGGARHLALAGEAVRGEGRAWPSPFADGTAQVIAARGRRVCVLASGDPFLHGVGATLAREVPAGEMDVHPGASAFSLAAARLGWPLAEVVTLSLHGRTVARLPPFLHPGVRLLALTSDSAGPGEIAALLSAFGFGASRITVLEALGGPRERVRAARAEDFALARIDPLNVVAIEVAAEGRPVVVPLTPGLSDAMFEHDGQLTKRDIRAMTLAVLAPRRGETLWDIGAGAGSVGIEWMLCDPSLKAVAVEHRADRAARIRHNAETLGVPDLAVVKAAAPAAYASLPRPDAVFIGGGASRPGVLDGAEAALPSGGRLVVNAVTLETEGLLLARHADRGGRLVRISVAQAEPVAGLTGWRPAMPVTQWSYEKP